MMSDDNNKEPKIVSDENWKEEAQREKEKLRQQEPSTPPPSSAASQEEPSGPLPAADFMTLVNSIMVQIFFCLGRLGDPKDGEPQVNLDLAKHNIDMLQVLEEKTKGNLTDEESKALVLALHEVRMQYVQIAQS